MMISSPITAFDLFALALINKALSSKTVTEAWLFWFCEYPLWVCALCDWVGFFWTLIVIELEAYVLLFVLTFAPLIVNVPSLFAAKTYVKLVEEVLVVLPFTILNDDILEVLGPARISNPLILGGVNFEISSVLILNTTLNCSPTPITDGPEAVKLISWAHRLNSINPNNAKMNTINVFFIEKLPIFIISTINHFFVFFFF